MQFSHLPNLSISIIIQISVVSTDTVLKNLTEFSSFKCRTEIGQMLDYVTYSYDTCARCYDYLPDWAFKNISLKYVYRRNSLLFDPDTLTKYVADPSNESHPIFSTFASEEFIRKWTWCCQAALQCCQQMATTPITTEGIFCPRTWDGWQCWPNTNAGSVATAPCLKHVYFKSEPPACPRYAFKVCWPNGTWLIHHETNSEWTNYANCGRVNEVRRLLYFHVATYAISIVFLIPALIIFTLYKQLQVYRITMHKNLFASLFFNAVFVILFKSIVMLDELDSTVETETILEVSGTPCKILFILTKYFWMTNYMWMFCEGFYLHKLIAAAFAEQKNLLMFYLIGWVFPIFPVGAYAVLRKIYADQRCWAIPEGAYEWLMNTPNLISLLLNLAFLCNIIRVLLTKLQATHASEPSQYRKAVRATLVLVPLFGVHFCLVIYRPESGTCEILEGYTYFSHLMDGLQGMIVAMIFCYLNGEVLYLLRRSKTRHKMQRGAWGKGCNSFRMTRTSVSTHISMTGEVQAVTPTQKRHVKELK